MFKFQFLPLFFVVLFSITTGGVSRSDAASRILSKQEITEKLSKLHIKLHSGQGKESCEKFLVVDYEKLGALAPNSLSNHEFTLEAADFLSYLQKNPDAEIEHLGLGGFGLVLKVKKPDGQVVAAKFPWIGKECLKNPQMMKILILNSVNVYKRLSQDPEALKRIPEFYSLDNEIPVEMKLINGPTLYEFIKLETETQKTWGLSSFLMQEMALAVSGFHRNKIIHRDVKPDNFILEKEGEKIKKIILADLDLGIRKGNPEGGGGSMGYVDPTVEYDGMVTEKRDMFALKITFQMLLLSKYMAKEDEVYPFSRFVDKSPFSYDRTVPELLSVISFYQFKNTDDLLEALKEAKKVYFLKKLDRTKEIDQFYLYFYNRFLKDLPRYQMQFYLQSSDELNAAAKRGVFPSVN